LHRVGVPEHQPDKVGASMTVATPVLNGPFLFFTNFYDGPLMLSLDDKNVSVISASKWK
jgi:hypothetical protein